MRKRVYLPSSVHPTIRPDRTTNLPLVQKEELFIQNLIRAEEDDGGEREELVTGGDCRGKHNSVSRGAGADREMMLPHRHVFSNASPA